MMVHALVRSSTDLSTTDLSTTDCIIALGSDKSQNESKIVFDLLTKSLGIYIIENTAISWENPISHRNRQGLYLQNAIKLKLTVDQSVDTD